MNRYNNEREDWIVVCFPAFTFLLIAMVIILFVTNGVQYAYWQNKLKQTKPTKPYEVKYQ
eukprot:TRINITY_DN13495_c2_g1_i1.p1 TRINITY_DN13495_c2_g1~~TRINITY_DN13495_c2_g1_i1.p1  ORF type:complete len:60 (-),score=4.93 TRINITY_DN13495_c2_g1_i1:113-292(-)